MQTLEDRHDSARQHLVPFLGAATLFDGATVVELSTTDKIAAGRYDPLLLASWVGGFPWDGKRSWAG